MAVIFNNVLRLDGTVTELMVDSDYSVSIDGSHLTMFPGLIDPHVHFRTPGMEHKENWVSASKAAIRGGYTTVFDMPNTLPPTITAKSLQMKQQLIDAQLLESGIPLRYKLYFGADKSHFLEIPLIKNDVVGIKVFMGCSTGNLVIDDDECLHAVFEHAAANNLLIAVHAEDEALIQERRLKFSSVGGYSLHSQIRNPDVALRAVEKAIDLSRLYNVKLYILHVSTQDELQLIKQAKKDNLMVYAETTPHHLFLNENDYINLGGRAVVNPPLREKRHVEALWAAINEGVIDTIGSDHAPHTESEKKQPYGQCPSGMPGIETTLPLLLTACREGLITVDTILRLTCHRSRAIFDVPENNDWVLVNRESFRCVKDEQLATRCQWSAFSGRELVGWPEWVNLRGKLIHLKMI